MKVLTSTLTDRALDWAVAMARGDVTFIGTQAWFWDESGNYVCFEPSTDWGHGGPIIERERIGLTVLKTKGWVADCPSAIAKGPTALVTAMLCFVTRKLGYEVDIPQELL